MVSQATSFVIVLVIIIIILILLFLYFRSKQSDDGPSANPNTTQDCAKFGTLLSNDPVCPSGSQLFDGVCYEETWPANASGGKPTKVDKCQVNYPGCGTGANGCQNSKLYNLSSNDPNALPPGTICNSTTVPGWNLGPGWYVQYNNNQGFCQQGGVQAIYCQSVGDLNAVGVCEQGDLWNGQCRGPDKCSSIGKVRTGECDCT